MRRILVDMARRKRSLRHGGGRQRRALLVGDLATAPISEDLLDLDEALSRLSAIDEQAAELVKLRVFAGMTVEEVAEYQGSLTAHGQASMGLCSGLAHEGDDAET